MRPLGEIQLDVLKMTQEQHGWHHGCGWTWNTRSTTTKIMESLLARGLLDRRLLGKGFWGHENLYTVNARGRKVLKDLKKPLDT